MYCFFSRAQQQSADPNVESRELVDPSILNVIESTMDWGRDGPYFPYFIRELINNYWGYDALNIPVDSQRHLRSTREAYLGACQIARDHLLNPGFSVDDLTAAVRKNPRVLLPRIEIITMMGGEILTLKGTLEELAVMLLDHTIGSDEGRADRLRRLRTLLPGSLNQVRNVTPDTERKNEDLTLAHRRELYNIFEMIKHNHFELACARMRAYIKSLKPAVITDKNYFLNLLNLIPLAFEVFIEKFKEFDDVLGAQTNEYCFATIKIAEAALPSMLRRRLKKGLLYLGCRTEMERFTCDIGDDVFVEPSYPHWESTIDFFIGPENNRWDTLVLDFFISIRQYNTFIKLISVMTSGQPNIPSVGLRGATLTTEGLASFIAKLGSPERSAYAQYTAPVIEKGWTGFFLIQAIEYSYKSKELAEVREVFKSALHWARIKSELMKPVPLQQIQVDIPEPSNEGFLLKR